MSSQVVMVSLEELVPSNHIYRKFKNLWNFHRIEKQLKKIETDNNYKGYGALRLFKCLLLQFMEDLSDRELERYIQENVTAKWFCSFEITDNTPDFTVFSRIRQRIGTSKLSKIFQDLRSQLKEKGYISEVFSFVDATHLISKANLWKERDKAIKEKYEKLNNETLPKVAFDKEARIGCKGKDKYWYGYKKHVSVDMQSGLINKVAITPANISDSNGFKNVCPNQGSVYADKAYCYQTVANISKYNGCHLAAIKKNNMKNKNKDLDKWYSRLHFPYERVFAHQNKRTRYIGVVKNQFTAFMEAICHNSKRLIILKASYV
jgi:IS5 family transposase